MTDYSARVNGLLGGSLPWSFGFHLTGTPSEGTLAAAFNSAVQVFWADGTNGIKLFTSADVTVTNTVVSTLNSTMHQVTSTPLPLAEVGTNVNPSMPWEVAPVISGRSPYTSKMAKGRAFLPPFSSDQVSAHVILASTAAKIASGLDTFFASVTSTGAAFFVFNRLTTKYGVPPYTKTILNDLKFSDKPGRQSRRVSKVVATYY